MKYIKLLLLLGILVSPFFASSQERNEIKIHYGEYLYNWPDHRGNTTVFGWTSTVGLDYYRSIAMNDRVRLNLGIGIINFKADRFRKLVSENGENELVTANVDSKYLNLIFSGEYFLTEKWSFESTFNNLLFIESNTEFLYQNRFYSTLDLGINYKLSKNLQFGVTSQLNISPIADYEVTLFSSPLNPKGSTKHLRLGGLGGAAVLKYRF